MRFTNRVVIIEIVKKGLQNSPNKLPGTSISDTKGLTTANDMTLLIVKYYLAKSGISVIKLTFCFW